MRHEVAVPPMGETIGTGRIGRWYVREGERVGEDELLFEIVTDKADVQVPSPVAGTVREIRAGEGTTVEVGTIVAVIET